MKYLISTVCGVFFLAGCSSAPVNDGPAEQTISEVRLQEQAVPPANPAQNTELNQAIASGNPERIKAVSTEVLAANPKDIKALNALSLYYYGKRQYGAATLLLEKVVAADPRQAVAYNNLGVIAQAQDETSRAIRMFRKAMEMSPRYYAAAANVASIYVREKDFSKAVYALEPFSNTPEIDNDGLNNYAVALAATGKAKEAAEVYERILKNTPDHKNAMLNYSVLLIENQEKYQEGLDLLNRLKFVGFDNESRQTINDLEVKAKAGLK